MARRKPHCDGVYAGDHRVSHVIGLGTDLADQSDLIAQKIGAADCGGRGELA